MKKSVKTILLVLSGVILLTTSSIINSGCSGAEVEEPCNNMSCINGTLDVIDCKCDCDDGWTGKLCDIPTSTSDTNLISADILYQSGTSLDYHTSDMHVNFVRNAGGLDSITIDSEISEGVWLYVQLIDENLGRITNDSFDVRADGEPRRAWVEHYNDNIIDERFIPPYSFSGGTMYLDTVDFNAKTLSVRYNCTIESDGFTEEAVLTNGKIRYNGN
jgi:hypothetical protein